MNGVFHVSRRTQSFKYSSPCNSRHYCYTPGFDEQYAEKCILCIVISVTLVFSFQKSSCMLLQHLPLLQPSICLQFRYLKSIIQYKVKHWIRDIATINSCRRWVMPSSFCLWQYMSCIQVTKKCSVLLYSFIYNWI